MSTERQTARMSLGEAGPFRTYSRLVACNAEVLAQPARRASKFKSLLVTATIRTSLRPRQTVRGGTSLGTFRPLGVRTFKRNGSKLRVPSRTCYSAALRCFTVEECGFELATFPRKMAPQAGFAPAATSEASRCVNEGQPGDAIFAERENGSSGWIRTSNPPVNSRMLCR